MMKSEGVIYSELIWAGAIRPSMPLDLAEADLRDDKGCGKAEFLL